MRAETTASSAKPLLGWTIKRLRTLAELRSATLPSGDTLRYLAETLAQFNVGTIDRACKDLESIEPSPYVPRWPSQPALVDACRRAASVTPESRFCGRCTNGRLRMRNGDVVTCECTCAACEGVGFVFLERFVPQYRHLPCKGMTRFARECECKNARRHGGICYE